MSAKGRTRDKNLSKLDNRMISTMLKSEKLAEKELEKKMKAIKALEHKSMVQICETSLDVKYDLRRKRNTQIMEEQLLEDPQNASVGAGRILRSPSVSRRSSLVPLATKQEDPKEKESLAVKQESSSESATNPAILINSGSKDDVSLVVDALSPRAASPRSSPPPEESPINEEEAQKLLKVFSQSSRGSQRRRTAPEITDLSPKLLIELAKRSAAAPMNGKEQSDSTLTAPLHTRRRGSATIEMLKMNAEQENSEEIAPPTLRRKESSAMNKSSLEVKEALLREKISEQAPLSPRLKQPRTPLLGRRGSGVTATLRLPSSQSCIRDVASEPMLPELKRPQSPSLRNSLSPVHATPQLIRPVSPTRSTSPMSMENAPEEPAVVDIGAEYDLTRRRGSRPGSAAGSLSPYHPAGRRGSEMLSQIDLNTLSPASPMRKAMEDPHATLNPAPASPNVYRRHSETVESLQGRVDEFLKTLAAKGS